MDFFYGDAVRIEQIRVRQALPGPRRSGLRLMGRSVGRQDYERSSEGFSERGDRRGINEFPRAEQPDRP
ncbi:MAG TPA: hypothetical protein DFS52_14015, partial [Myxococcales bacterium]|nr:hypothetical protein [Myxococcales bacterium]